MNYFPAPFFVFFTSVYVLPVGSPAPVHLPEQLVIRGFLYEVVDVSLYRQR